MSTATNVVFCFFVFVFFFFFFLCVCGLRKISKVFNLKSVLSGVSYLEICFSVTSLYQ